MVLKPLANEVGSQLRSTWQSARGAHEHARRRYSSAPRSLIPCEARPTADPYRRSDVARPQCKPGCPEVLCTADVIVGAHAPTIARSTNVGSCPGETGSCCRNVALHCRASPCPALGCMTNPAGHQSARSHSRLRVGSMTACHAATARAWPEAIVFAMDRGCGNRVQARWERTCLAIALDVGPGEQAFAATSIGSILRVARSPLRYRRARARTGSSAA